MRTILARRPKAAPAASLSPIDDTVRALVALLASIERNSSAPAVAAFQSAIRRHGRNLADTAGPDALRTALAQIEALSPAYAEPRRAVLVEAWAGLPGWSA